MCVVLHVSFNLPKPEVGTLTILVWQIKRSKQKDWTLCPRLMITKPRFEPRPAVCFETLHSLWCVPGSPNFLRKKKYFFSICKMEMLIVPYCWGLSEGIRSQNRCPSDLHWEGVGREKCHQSMVHNRKQMKYPHI